ncbi:MAG: tRNA (adenosine(37)-N6)-threonylcarbamoyltransferase complex transferase subunit TsaD [Nitrospira sp.]|nr:tRNA (adenosine(37)-N6)-threonylcarbamoyltransferase complex transferase subunit TsaD [Nitrospira sp.]
MSYILGIESSCDETAASVLKDGVEILSNIIASQCDIHNEYGGIVPELACRRHIEVIYPIVNEAVEKAGIKLSDLSAVAVTSGPGLIGALLVGVSFAKSLSYALKIPLISVNHLEGHLWAINLTQRVQCPFIALVVSGGHTNLYAVEDIGLYKLLGNTLDDAAGEAFDKVSKILGLGYPGGPAIEKFAESGDAEAIALPRGLLKKGGFDFSFSGMKTATLSGIKGRYSYARVDEIPEILSEADKFRSDIAASFQKAVVDVLVLKSLKAVQKTGINRLVLSGGVACNKLLREKMKELELKEKITVYLPEPVFCTDNAAMIAWVGYQYYKKGIFAGLRLNPDAQSSIGK